MTHTYPPMDWLLWQLADSAFPVGAFAHSAGVEAAAQLGAVTDGNSIREFFLALLRQTAKAALPFLFAAYRDPGGLAEIDLFCDAFLSNHVANRASRAQGGAVLTAARRIFSPPALEEIHRQIRAENLPGHLPGIFGVVGQTLGIDEERCGHLFLFTTLRGANSSAVRLGIIGPMEAQRIQWELSEFAATLVNPARETPMQLAAQTAPFLDLLQANQDRLYSRLFQS